jgi:hypothetical protein
MPAHQRFIHFLKLQPEEKIKVVRPGRVAAALITAGSAVARCFPCHTTENCPHVCCRF